ncbi:unnamed protein product [Durusdinium trenchii]|uniref:Uncharacterized protein n=1 Tax=Durusdinium trenchii TaxID=1381693 RepID=A0ABP0PH42_9DINO
MSNIHQPTTDCRRGRSYLSFELPNGIQVVVASDPNRSTPAAAALAVLAGSIHEPKDRPGLAHFCEHMLLHGTIQPCYGDANFAEYIKQSGGRHNAVTTVLQTCYAFEVQSSKLEGALSRFARFFASPIFSRSYQQQELQAIDAEHSMNATNDFRRQWAILLLDANPRHPYHWTSGCSKSLQNPNLPDLHRSLESFHSSNYKSERMSLAVVGSEATQELASWVRKYFSCVPSSGTKDPGLSYLMGDSLGGGEPSFLKEDFCRQIWIVPVKEVHQLKLCWLLPWQVAHWRSKPTAYIKYLLEQEGDGSLRAALSRAGLSHNQTTTCFDYHGVASTLEFSVDLVDTKDTTVMEVGCLIFAYISMLRAKGVQRAVLEEIQELQQLSFHYPDISNSSPFDFVQDLACNLHYYPAEEVLAADHLIYRLDAEGSQSVLKLTTVNHARLSLISKDFDAFCTSTEPWYGGRFLKEDSIKDDWKTKWTDVETDEWAQIAEQQKYRFPPRNTYLPADLSMRYVPQEDVPIEMEVAEDSCRAWFKQSKVDQPKAAAAFSLYSSEMSTPKQVALAHLYCKLVQQELKAEAFQLKAAGATYQLEVGEFSGFVLQVFGFRDTLPVLARRISETLSSSRRSPSWRYLRDQQERSLKNSSRGQAYNQALNGLEELLFQRPALSDLIQATSALEEEGMCFSDLFQRFFGSGRCLVEGLIVGNLDWADAIQLLNATLGPWRDVWHQEAVLEPCDRLCNVPSPVEMLLPRSRLGRDLLTIVQLDGKNSEDRNSCSVESLCNIATSTPENEALAALLMQIWKSMFYNELRTRQQLGYVVSSFMRTRVTHISLIFLVQTERAPEVALKSIDRFLDHACHHILSVLTEREFHEHCESLALQLEEPPQNIWEALSQDWLFIQERSFAFRSRKQQVTLLRSCTLQRLRDFVKNEAIATRLEAIAIRLR